MKQVFSLTILIGILITGPLYAPAENLGVWGDVYPIAEPDFLSFIQNRLQTMQKTGEMLRMQTAFVEQVKATIERPPAVLGLTTTTKPRLFFYDPTWMTKTPIRDAQGRVLIPAGQKVNPLNWVHLNEVLLFFNADDAREVSWAKEQMKQYPVTKIILTEGNIKTTETHLNAPIYFDQYGYLVHRLGITHIPCLVKQVGHQLEIQEFSVDEAH